MDLSLSGSQPSVPYQMLIALGLVTGLVVGCNKPPEAISQTVNVDEDAKISISLRGNDADGSISRFIVVTNPTSGTLSGSPPIVTYEPNPDFFGSDSLGFKVVDDDGTQSSEAMVRISVTSVNDPPLAESSNEQTREDTPVRIRPSVHDIDGSVAAYFIAAEPHSGRVDVEANGFLYKPKGGFHGVDQFVYFVEDLEGAQSEQAVIQVTVSSVNDLPTSKSTRVETLEDTPLTISLTGSDRDGDALSYEIVSYPSRGKISGGGSSWVYSPDSDFHGQDAFTYRVRDSKGATSTDATVTIDVGPLNDPPQAESSSWATREDGGGVYIELKGEDPDGEITGYSILERPQFGSVSGTGKSWKYTPKENFSGEDFFTFSVFDDEGHQSEPATVLISVSEDPDPPEIHMRRSYYQVRVGETINIPVFVSDPEGDADRFRIRGYRENGEFHPRAGRANRLPSLSFTGERKGTRNYEIEVVDRQGMIDAVPFTIEVLNSVPRFDTPRARYDKSAGYVEFTLRVRDVDGTVRHCVIETIDGRRAKSISVTENSTYQVSEGRPFSPQGSCRSNVDRSCTLTVRYTPEVVDGHSRRIRFYAVDNEGDESQRDFVRIETRNLQ